MFMESIAWPDGQDSRSGRGSTSCRPPFSARMSAQIAGPAISNSVHPSFAETPMVLEGIARARDPERVRAGLSRAAPMGRMGKAEEVALTILFLASDESSFTTGGEFMVDGGLTAQ